MPSTTASPAASAVLPSAVSQLIALFEADLAGVAFPDVDLARLVEHAQRCIDQAAEVAELEAKLAAAQLRASDRKQELNALAVKAVAYASVYAADNEELAGKLQALQLSQDGQRGTRRGSASKSKTGSKRKGSKASAQATSQGALGLSNEAVPGDVAEGAAHHGDSPQHAGPIAAVRTASSSRVNSPPARIGAAAAAS